jgi:hypothetical protein
MSRMVRKQVYISEEQQAALRQRAKELGVTESALIRRGLDYAAGPGGGQPDGERAWQDALAFMRERARIEAAQRQRGWTREELHGERPSYLPG